jgi:hypothetical protein
MAPEIYEAADHTSAVDVYSFALISYEVFVGEPAFPAPTALPVPFRKVSQGDRPQLPESIAAPMANIIRKG